MKTLLKDSKVIPTDQYFSEGWLNHQQENETHLTILRILRWTFPRGTVAFTAAISCGAMARQWQFCMRLLQRMQREEVPVVGQWVIW